MADRFTKKKRSKIMSNIKAKDTNPEMVVRRLIHAMGYRYRLHIKDLPGKPDLVFRPRRKVIFIHGCFWHQHEGCKVSHIPKSNLSYWLPKLEKTKKRDKTHIQQLNDKGWGVFVIWECQLKNIEIVKKKIRGFLDG